jgi:hypothetical protein
MTPKEFVIWLDGYLRGNGDVGLTTMQVRDVVNKITEVDLTGNEKNIIIDRVMRPTNPIRIEDPPYGDDDDFPGRPNKIFM